MRLLSILLVSCLSLLGQVETPSEHFANIQELRQWAEKNSWGGFSVEAVKHSGTEALIVRRSFTSGIQSCALSVFIYDKTGLLEALKLRAFHGYWIDFKQRGDSITLESYDQAKAKPFEILQFSISSLALQSFEK